MSAVFLSADLTFSSRLVGAAQALGKSLAVAARPEALAAKLNGECTLVAIDLALDGLDLRAAVDVVRSLAPRARIVAYGAHVNEQALGAAEAAGCDLVLPRGQFHKQYAELLRDWA